MQPRPQASSLAFQVTGINYILELNFYLIIYSVLGGKCHLHIWKLEDSFQESCLLFSALQALDIELGLEWRCYCPLSHLINPEV